VQVFVVGDAAVPGSYVVSSAGSALTALYAAGGPSLNGSMRRIEIRRGGRSVDSLDLYDYLLRGDASHDRRLETGDILFVPVHGARVRVLGEVIRPAIYELKQGETLADLIRDAGGFTAHASRRRIQVQRVLPPAQRGPSGQDRIVLDVSADQFDNENAPPLEMQPGDDVQVFPVVDRIRNRISVNGNVWSPGPQGFTPGMRLSEALRRAGGPKPDSYLGRILVTRTRPDSTLLELHAAFKDSAGEVLDDIPLAEDDEVQVFSTTAFRPNRYVVIGGAVKNGGRIPYRDGLTLRDAVLLAGGVTESAYLREAEIARLPDDRAGGVVATTMRVPLDSTYLFDRKPDGTYLGPPGISAQASNAPETQLRPYDNVLIMHQPDWELQRIVYVGGAVRFPGRYSLKTQRERLRDVLGRAGGLTAEGYADGIVLYRNADRTGRIGIDLPAVLRDSTSRDNIILQDADSIVIPEYNPVVKVTGAINSPVAVTYSPGADIDYYVRAAGGATHTADVSRAYVRQPNGRVETQHKRPFFLPGGRPHPRAGAEIVVPEHAPNDRFDWGAVAVPLAQILGSMVAIVAVLKR
jgi:protein involved in polysaccharide export with SLBB domain